MNRERPRHSARAAAPSGRTVVGVLVTTAVCVMTLAAVSTARGAAGEGADAPTQSAGRVGADAVQSAAAAGRRTGAVTPEGPRRVRLPSGSVVGIRPVATTKDGTLDVPGDVNVSGWWRGGSRIGDPFGSTLLAAHVDSSTQGLGPYAELLSVSEGASIVVTSKHLQQKYAVSSLELLDKGTLADHREVYSPSGSHRLTLVTCAGPYIKSKGGYQQLAVVTATPVGPPTELAS